MPVAATVGTPVPGAATPDVATADAPVPSTAAPDVVAPEAPDVMAPEAPATAAVGAATASASATGAATASISAPEVPTAVPDVPSPSAQPTAEEELEEVSGRQLPQGSPEEEAAPLPQVLVRVRRTIEEATSTAETAFRREWAAL
ncbi:predicted GPI-anchored protein 58 [Panicum virgatum]|uniref:predicted GPI-anchored protein 58 n=1 Tax=Panicum virgatum TaxID=38727 RepID=UPI0019D5BA30|nr:predicted GPI-anchored protein 58 [Panicum virgatum]